MTNTRDEYNIQLNNVTVGTWIIVKGDYNPPVKGNKVKIGQRLFFSHIEGMYCYCENEMGKPVYLEGRTEVSIDKNQELPD
jgi:hypothetical protein|tara:strand:+ start:219 stop:461 length:243 start_codon:yes stop_codon:yes gene_type:complete